MSVCQISVNEFGLFAALATHLKLTTFANAVSFAELLSISNCAALRAQYGLALDSSEGIPATYDDIEANALNRLAKRDFSGPCGGLIYNCITNNGELFLGELSAPRSGETLATLAELQEMESAVSKWIKTEAARIERQTEDDVAFAECGPLPKLTVDECRERMEQLGANRVIYAEFRVNESDSMTDYYGGRSGRSVIIGFGTGKRESFKQLRAVAREFPPTNDLAFDVWTVRVLHKNDIQGNGCMHWKGSVSHWHDEMSGKEFRTESEARAFMESAGNPHPVHVDKQVAEFEFDLTRTDYENSENYSMGGGNYLGRHRYSGWIVRSSTYPMAGEFFEAPRKVEPVAKKSRKAKEPVAEKAPAEEFDAELMELASALQSVKNTDEPCIVSHRVTLKRGRKYVNVDCNGSGLLMIDMEQRWVYGIRAYGQLNKRRCYGTVSDFIARLKSRLPAEESTPTTAELYSANV
jgi:hypothetical protein